MGQTRTYGLVLPPGYQLQPHKSYPVIFLLHGGHGDAGGWLCGVVTTDRFSVETAIYRVSLTVKMSLTDF